MFDLGDTLITFGKIDYPELFNEGAKNTYDFLKTCAQPVGSFGRYRRQSLISLNLRRLLSSITGNDFDSLSLLKKTGEKRGIRLNTEQWEQVTWLWYEPLGRTGRAEPQIAETLATLRNTGLKLGIVSNTFVHASSLERHLEQLGILDFFDVRLYSYQFKFRKPDARIFKIAADQIGEKPENIIFIGDRIDNDIEPAINLNMTAVLKNAHSNTNKKTPQDAWKIDQIAQLPQLIEKINTPHKHPQPSQT